MHLGCVLCLGAAGYTHKKTKKLKQNQLASFCSGQRSDQSNYSLNVPETRPNYDILPVEFTLFIICTQHVSYSMYAAKEILNFLWLEW